jgi:hypothetical protein
MNAMDHKKPAIIAGGPFHVSPAGMFGRMEQKPNDRVKERFDAACISREAVIQDSLKAILISSFAVSLQLLIRTRNTAAESEEMGRVLTRCLLGLSSAGQLHRPRLVEVNL